MRSKTSARHHRHVGAFDHDHALYEVVIDTMKEKASATIIVLVAARRSTRIRQAVGADAIAAMRVAVEPARTSWGAAHARLSTRSSV